MTEYNLFTGSGRSGLFLVPSIEHIEFLYSQSNTKYSSSLDINFRVNPFRKQHLLKPYFDLLNLHRIWPISTYEVQSYSELLAIITHYNYIAKKFSGEIYLRGQSKEYEVDKVQSISPAGFRGEFKGVYSDPSSKLLKEIHDEWHPLLLDYFTRELSPETYDSILYKHQIDNSLGIHKQAYNMQIMLDIFLFSIAMHYGFPTSCLDVTKDINSALWFALNKLHKEGDKFVYRLNPNIEDSIIYIYFHSDIVKSQVYDLNSLIEMKDLALRPFVQNASAFPFLSFSSPFIGDLDPSFMYSSGPSFRVPSACIKLSKDFINDPSLNLMTQEEMFPLNDPIYCYLKKNKASYLALYD